jgi:hypothetical protein
MFEVSLYKTNASTTFDRDLKTTVSFSTLDSAIEAWNYGSALAVVFGYDSCAIFDVINNKHLNISYANPNHKKPLQY